MKVLAFMGVGKIGIVEKPIPDPGPNDAVIKTTGSLICTSDVHTVRGVIPLPEGRGLGHESVGIVYKLGAQVRQHKEADRVAVNAITPCGHCHYCQRGFTSQCGGMLGGYKFSNERDGNMAEYFLVNDADYNLAPIPDMLSDEQQLRIIAALVPRKRVCVVWEGSEPLPHRRDGPLTRYVLDNFRPAARNGSTEIWVPEN